ncbi:protein turtle homolog B-like isoform X2 [Brevipalpus obovatus]|uniref:protein turtle homolog B-like isoform X2 n=1 Tax=Brevipalpus obovatus TaxID=246614 RepID=UPI003D9FAD80
MRIELTLILVHLISDTTRTLSEYVGIVGKSVALECNTSLWGDSIVSLILWYKGSQGIPIYSVDSRTSTLTLSKHTSIDQRFYLNPSTLPPKLVIDPIRENDEGDYRCRVDYKNDRTQHYSTKLSVIVPPKEMVILSNQGKILDGITGPYDEGSSFVATCETHGGKPLPMLSWWSGGHLVDADFSYGVDGRVRNPFRMSSLSRRDFMREIECKASTANHTVLLKRTIFLDMRLKPLKVNLIKPEKPFISGQKAELECLTFGSKPRARLKWWKNGREYIHAIERLNTDTNFTISRLTLPVTTEDNGKYISCRSDNPDIHGSVIEDGFKLVVHYLPQLTINLGANIKRDSIKEGGDVYLECSVKANPRVDEILWTFENEPLRTNKSAGIIASNQSLVLQRVKRNHRGHYRCLARNQLGQSTSDPFFLRVKYPPRCQMNQKTVYATARNELVNITCAMDADPVDLQFRWRMNASSASAEIDSFQSNGSSSVAFYMARSRYGFGIMSCSASNEIGPSIDNCNFSINPAGPPEKVSNCITTNHSMTSIHIECLAGDQNGLKQSFHLEVYNSFTHTLERNISNPIKPTFMISDLNSGTSYSLSVYSSNAKGPSLSYTLVAATLGEPERQMSPETIDQVTFSSTFIILIATVIFLVCISIILILAIRHRKEIHNRRYKQQQQQQQQQIQKSHSAKDQDQSCVSTSNSTCDHHHNQDDDGFDTVKSKTTSDALNIENAVFEMKNRPIKTFPQGGKSDYIFCHPQENHRYQITLNIPRDQLLPLMDGDVTQATPV